MTTSPLYTCKLCHARSFDIEAMAKHFQRDHFTPSPSQREEVNRIVGLGQDAVIRALRRALKERSGREWSVKRGKGTAYGWISIKNPPRINGGHLTESDARLLADLLGLENPVHYQGIQIADSYDYYRLYLHRAMFGDSGGFTASPYWD